MNAVLSFWLAYLTAILGVVAYLTKTKKDQPALT